MKRKALEKLVPSRWRLRLRERLQQYRALKWLSKPVSKLQSDIRTTLDANKSKKEYGLAEMTSIADSVKSNISEYESHKKYFNKLLTSLTKLTFAEYQRFEATLYDEDPKYLSMLPKPDSAPAESHWSFVVEHADEEYFFHYLDTYQNSISECSAELKFQMFNRIKNSESKDNRYYTKVYTVEEIQSLLKSKFSELLSDLELVQTVWGEDAITSVLNQSKGKIAKIIRDGQLEDYPLLITHLKKYTPEQHESLLILILKGQKLGPLRQYAILTEYKNLLTFLRKGIYEENRDVIEILPEIIAAKILPELRSSKLAYMLSVYYDPSKRSQVRRWTDMRGIYKPDKSFESAREFVGLDKSSELQLKPSVLNYVYNFAFDHEMRMLSPLVKKIESLLTRAKSHFKRMFLKLLRDEDPCSNRSDQATKLLEALPENLDAPKEIDKIRSGITRVKTLLSSQESKPECTAALRQERIQVAEEAKKENARFEKLRQINEGVIGAISVDELHELYPDKDEKELLEVIGCYNTRGIQVTGNVYSYHA